MADINLEAEQVIGEEEESAPVKARGLLGRKTLIAVAAIVIIEGILLSLVFESMREPSSSEASAETAPLVSMKDLLMDPGRIKIEGITIYDDSDNNIRGDKRFTVDIILKIDGEIYREIQSALEINQAAMELVQDLIKEKVRDFMLEKGGNYWKSPVYQKQFGALVKDYLNQELIPFRGKILDVYLDDYRPARQ